MTIRSAVLGFAQVTGSPATILFTVPAGQTYIVKSVLMSNQNNVDALTSVFIQGAVANTFGNLIYETFVQSTHKEWQGFAVLQPGDSLRASIAAQSMWIWASGARLSGVAP